MKATRIYQWLLMTALVGGMSLSIASCSDDDNNSNGSGGQTEAEYEQQQSGWDIITQLSDERTAPDGWEDMTFEPTIGRAKDGDPYTRIVMTNDVATAAVRYGGLIGQPSTVNESTTGYSFSLEGLGSLNYKRGSESEQYLAEVAVDIKQMPHLKKILYQTEQQAGLNASFAGTAYYRFGDVVRDSEGCYWICVRPSFGPEGKGDSHWMNVTTSLQAKNLFKYEYKGKSWAVPTGLGSNTEHMQNLAEMLYAMLKPAEWLQALAQSPKPAMFHDFSTSRIKYHNIYFWQRVCKAWEENNLFNTIFNHSKSEMLNSLNGDGLNLLYSGYSWYTKTSWNCSLWQVNFKNGKGKLDNMHNATYTKPTKRMENLTVDFGSQSTGVNGNFFDNDNKLRVIVRYKTGQQLSSNGSYNTKTAISGCTDVYVYNKHFYKDNPGGIYDLNGDLEESTADMLQGDTYYGESYYRIGDVVKDEDGALWFCVQNSGVMPDFAEEVTEKGEEYVYDNFKTPISATQYSWFISLTPTATNGQSLFQKYGSTYSNVPTLNEAKYISYVLPQMLWDGLWGKTSKSHQWAHAYRNILEYAKVDLTKLVVRRDSLFDALVNKPNHIMCLFTNIVYRQYNGNTQDDKARYLRLIYDGCSLDTDAQNNPKPGSRMNKIWQQNYYTAGGYTKEMILDDMENANTVRNYAYDKWVTLPWYTLGNSGPDQGDGTSTDCYPHEKIRTSTYSNVSVEDFLWDEAKKDFAKPYTSMYNEPVFVCRVMKVKDRGTKATQTTDGKKLTAEYLCTFGNTREQGRGYLEQVAQGIGPSQYNFNGAEMKALRNIPLLGEKN